jgi:isopentenyl-diphosphate delta-isomerase
MGKPVGRILSFSPVARSARKREMGRKDSEDLILVDKEDRVLGYSSREECHRGKGILHRAFSVFLFNDRGELLIQRRGRGKELWPLYWSNSCCSHPRIGETYESAIRRRLDEELGLVVPVSFLFTLHYRAKFDEQGSENELCAVYAGRSSGPVRANAEEIEEWKFVDLKELEADIERRPERYTPWFLLEWKRIRRHHTSEIDSLPC